MCRDGPNGAPYNNFSQCDTKDCLIVTVINAYFTEEYRQHLLLFLELIDFIKLFVYGYSTVHEPK